MDIKVLTVCLLMTGQYVMDVIADNPTDAIINSCIGQCKPSNQELHCPAKKGYTSMSVECESSIVCCQTKGNVERCLCSEECREGWEKNVDLTCQKCCKTCDCVFSREDCPAPRQISGDCSDSNETYKHCCDESGKCHCVNVQLTGGCGEGETEFGMCLSCCDGGE